MFEIGESGGNITALTYGINPQAKYDKIEHRTQNTEYRRGIEYPISNVEFPIKKWLVQGFEI